MLCMCVCILCVCVCVFVGGGRDLCFNSVYINEINISLQKVSYNFAMIIILL